MHALPHREAIRSLKLRLESDAIPELLDLHGLSTEDRSEIVMEARSLLDAMRDGGRSTDFVETLFQEIDLASPEGLALMSLAEALLRVPDAATAEALIQEKLGEGDWHRFRAGSRSVRVKAAAILMSLAAALGAADASGKLTLPLIRNVAQHAIQRMARRFVFAPTIEAALSAAIQAKSGERYSFDMLGEGARTKKQAEAFRETYAKAIAAVGRAVTDRESIGEPGISVKLSALNSRFEPQRADLLRHELLPVIEELAGAAAERDVSLTIDAEEADRLEVTLEVVSYLARSRLLRDWDGLGLAVQAYGKRAPAVLDWLTDLGRETGHQFSVRLVKGAYWDAEIKHAQAAGLSEYPVYVRKAATDVSYLGCARRMLDSERIVPQFATHNAHTVTAIRRMAGNRPFEFQRLHGMGERLYASLREQGMTAPVRVYAPVGRFKELLPYLIRRMLENTANSSFVRVALDARRPVDTVVEDPIAVLANPVGESLLLPREIFGNRMNSTGLDLADACVVARLARAARAASASPHPVSGERLITSPADRRRIVGTVKDTEVKEVSGSIARADATFDSWRTTDVDDRARALERAAGLFEERIEGLSGLIVSEAGRTIRDAVAEVRECVDFCRFYAAEARRLFADSRLPGITGERNVFRLTGRGVFACISPWNFPLAIFTGQVAAALAAGNSVVAKPAPQTPLIAAIAVRLLHEAGIPASALCLVQGDAAVGKALITDPRIVGVAFTGSTATAQAINRALAARDTAIGKLIAETGGVNAMFVDASALPEQAVDDVIASGFLSAGQRCSSLRHLFVQEDCADLVTEMVAGAMDTLRIGDPADPATDVGPVIDGAARDLIDSHIQAMRAKGARILRQLTLPAECRHGTFVAPALIELPDPTMLDKEVFGPVVHLSRWRRSQLDAMLAHLRGAGFGLTLGIHSRVNGFAERVVQRVRCGNAYINRNIVGAVVGAQPFGGRGLSGTGPKAGGPNYLPCFATEETVTANLTAIGGDIDLLAAAAESAFSPAFCQYQSL